MALNVNGNSVTDCYREMLHMMHIYGKEESSRNGKVLTLTQGVELTMFDPQDRVLLDPLRNANPFFHVMEFVWMMTGSSEVAWISQFNKRMVEYSNLGRLHGAYGARWHRGEQIMAVIEKLHNRSSRQAVISMWEPVRDNKPGYGDYPCNTHAYFRVVKGALNMTVCNRSNDVIWGMLGANVVHMTLLQEVLAHELNLSLGEYRVYTNNAHIYEHHWPLIERRNEIVTPVLHEPYPLLGRGDSYRLLCEDCADLVAGELHDLSTPWVNEVAVPIYLAWKEHKLGREAYSIADIKDENWRIACQDWISRKLASTVEQDKLPGITRSDLL